MQMTLNKTNEFVPKKYARAKIMRQRPPKALGIASEKDRRSARVNAREGLKSKDDTHEFKQPGRLTRQPAHVKTIVPGLRCKMFQLLLRLGLRLSNHSSSDEGARPSCHRRELTSLRFEH